jgi:DHA1 family multidrug resistance protein-like MFS transporter
MEKSSRNKIIILSFVLIVVMLGFGMIAPIFPFLVEDLGAGGIELGLLMATAALTELVFSPMWGSISDRVGRKPILMIGIFGYGISILFFGLSTQLWMLFVFRAIGGVLSSATLATAMAYIGDTTSEDDRAGGMGILGAAMSLGVIAGPGFGGWLGAISIQTPFFVAAGISLVGLILIFLMLPESLPPEAREQANGKLRTAQFRQLWGALFSPIGILLFMMFLLSFGLANFEAVFGLYALDKFGYGPERVGMILTVVGVVSAAGKIFTGPLTRNLGDAPVVKASLLTGAIGYLVLLAANTYPTILLATGFFILSKTFLRPALLSLISKHTTVGQGAAMGLGNAFMSLGRIAGPIWAGLIFDVNYDYPYITGSVILFIGFLVSLIWVREYRREIPDTQPASDR